jgi:hypothetical protein
MNNIQSDEYFKKYIKYKQLYLQYKMKRIFDGSRHEHDRYISKHQRIGSSSVVDITPDTVMETQTQSHAVVLPQDSTDGAINMEIDIDKVKNVTFYNINENELQKMLDITNIDRSPKNETLDKGFKFIFGNSLDIDNLICCKNSGGFSHAIHGLMSSLKVFGRIKSEIQNTKEVVIIDGLNIENNSDAVETLDNYTNTDSGSILIIHFTSDVVSTNGQDNNTKRNHINNKLDNLNILEHITVYTVKCPRGYILYNDCSINSPANLYNTNLVRGTKQRSNNVNIVNQQSVTDDGIMAWLIVLLSAFNINIQIVTGDVDTLNYYDLENDKHIRYAEHWYKQIGIHPYRNQLSIASALVLCALMKKPSTIKLMKKPSTIKLINTSTRPFCEIDNYKYIANFTGFCIEYTDKKQIKINMDIIDSLDKFKELYENLENLLKDSNGNNYVSMFINLLEKYSIHRPVYLELLQDESAVINL